MKKFGDAVEAEPIAIKKSSGVLTEPKMYSTSIGLGT
jgi:hypothetical protein